MFKCCIPIISILCLWTFDSQAQNDVLREEYEQFRHAAQAEYEDFRSKANAEYVKFMREAWEWYRKAPATPKPKDDMVPPVKYEKGNENVPQNVPVKDVVTPPLAQPQPKPVTPIRENDAECRIQKFVFFGTHGEVRLPKDFTLKLTEKNEEGYAKAWERLSATDMNNTLRDCLVLRMKHQLCDWAYLMMLGELGKTIFGDGTNEAELLQAFLMCQSGYKIRLALTGKKNLMMLFKSEHSIFALDGLRMNDGLYYALRPIEGEGLSVCDIEFPNERPLSLVIAQEQIFEQNVSEQRTLTSEAGGVSIRTSVNKNTLDFYESYPTSMLGDDIMSRWAMYANTPMNSVVCKNLYQQMKDKIVGKTDTEAANLLLHWVQTAFVYEYDDKVWGDDRAFFAEETLYYPYCDCEDRSILYSKLIRDLLGLNVLLVYYPGHLATAVEFDTEVKGDAIVLDGRRFVVCDPTYIGAPVGLTMPGMDNRTAKVILLNTK